MVKFVLEYVMIELSEANIYIVPNTYLFIHQVVIRRFASINAFILSSSLHWR